MTLIKQKINNLKEFAKKHPTLSAALFFLALTFLFTYPLGTRFASQVPAGDGDAFQAFANIDSHTRLVTGAGFYAGVESFLKSLGTYSPYVLLGLFFNKYAAYNIVFFLSYILSGLGAYLLAYHFTQRRGASLVAGALFAFAPFHYYQSVAVHLGSMQQQWVPFAALFLIKFLDELKFRDYFCFLIFLFLLALAEHQLLAFSLLFLAVIALVKIWQNKGLLKNKKLWLYLGLSSLFLAFVVFVVFGDLLKVATSGDNFLDPGSGAAKKYAMKPWEPLLPPSFQAFWPGINVWLRESVKIQADWRDSYFASFTALGLLGVLAWQLWRKKNPLALEKTQKEGVRLWALTFLVMYVFAWGPGIKLFNFNLVLPYNLVYKYLPFYENIRVTGRLFMFAMLALAMLAAYAIKFLQPRLKSGFGRKRFVPILLAAIMVEFWVGPLATMSLAYSPFYDRVAQEPESYKLLEIPGGTDYAFASYKMLTNNVHGKQSLDGMPLARSIDGQFTFQQTTPVIKQLLYTLPKGNDPEEKLESDIIERPGFEKATDILNYYGVRYLTVSRKYTDAETAALLDGFIRKYVALDETYRDDFLAAYKVRRQNPAGFYAQLLTKNEQISNLFTLKNGTPGREFGNGAQFKIVNMGSAAQKALVEIKTADQNSLSFSIKEAERKSANSFEVLLQPGENVFTFAVTDALGKPVLSGNKKKTHQALVVTGIAVN